MAFIKLLKPKTNYVKTTRKGEYQAIYQDKHWLKLRNAKRRNNPLCEECEKRNRVTPMREVHHKKPFDTGRTPDEIQELAFDYDNLVSLCDPCHDEAHKNLLR
jgi:5-methylcytosine-specific restriction protein A